MATTISQLPAEGLPVQSATVAQDVPPAGLSSEEARQRLEKSGPNAMPNTALHPLRSALGKFWAPVPCMLQAAVVLELVLGEYLEATIIAALLVFNAALGLFQESRAQATLTALKSRLALNSSVRRDGAWKNVAAAELVPGDVVKLSLGGVVVADVRLTAGEVLLDQSMLTGEVDIGRRRNRHGALTRISRGWHACSGGRFHVHLGFRKGSGIRASRDCRKPGDSPKHGHSPSSGRCTPPGSNSDADANGASEAVASIGKRTD